MAKQKYKWLDRRVAQYGPYLTLVLSQAELDDAVKGLTKEYIRFPQSGALCTTFTRGETNQLCAIVQLSEYSQKNNSPIEMAGLLVHEAVHVWQRFSESIGEHNPATEQEAYAIQAISQELLAEYSRRLQHG